MTKLEAYHFFALSGILLIAACGMLAFLGIYTGRLEHPVHEHYHSGQLADLYRAAVFFVLGVGAQLYFLPRTRRIYRKMRRRSRALRVCRKLRRKLYGKTFPINFGSSTPLYTYLKTKPADLDGLIIFSSRKFEADSFETLAAKVDLEDVGFLLSVVLKKLQELLAENGCEIHLRDGMSYREVSMMALADSVHIIDIMLLAVRNKFAALIEHEAFLSNAISCIQKAMVFCHDFYPDEETPLALLHRWVQEIDQDVSILPEAHIQPADQS